MLTILTPLGGKLEDFGQTFVQNSPNNFVSSPPNEGKWNNLILIAGTGNMLVFQKDMKS